MENHAKRWFRRDRTPAVAAPSDTPVVSARRPTFSDDAPSGLSTKTARTAIIVAANRYRMHRYPFLLLRPLRVVTFKPYTMRHINQAVNVVRQNSLLPQRILEQAGFNG